MTIIHTVSPRTGGNIYVGRPINVPDHALRGSRDSLARSRRPGPTRPAGAPPRYPRHRCRDVGRSAWQAPGHDRDDGWAALLAGIIISGSAWLPISGRRPTVTQPSPRLRTCPTPRRGAGRTGGIPAGRGRAGGADAPAPQVVQRIRELNDLGSPALVAGQTLIAPIG